MAKSKSGGNANVRYAPAVADAVANEMLVMMESGLSSGNETFSPASRVPGIGEEDGVYFARLFAGSETASKIEALSIVDRELLDDKWRAELVACVNSFAENWNAGSHGKRMPLSGSYDKLPDIGKFGATAAKREREWRKKWFGNETCMFEVHSEPKGEQWLDVEVVLYIAVNGSFLSGEDKVVRKREFSEQELREYDMNGDFGQLAKDMMAKEA